MSGTHRIGALAPGATCGAGPCRGPAPAQLSRGNVALPILVRPTRTAATAGMSVEGRAIPTTIPHVQLLADRQRRARCRAAGDEPSTSSPASAASSDHASQEQQQRQPGGAAASGGSGSGSGGKKRFRSSWDAKEAHTGTDYLFELGNSSDVNLNIDTGQNSTMIDSLVRRRGRWARGRRGRERWVGGLQGNGAGRAPLARLRASPLTAPRRPCRPPPPPSFPLAPQFTGKILGHVSDIADGSLRGFEFRSLNNVVGDYYVPPAFLEKVVVHIAKNYLVAQGALDAHVRGGSLLSWGLRLRGAARRGCWKWCWEALVVPSPYYLRRATAPLLERFSAWYKR